jgi:hypothetical protein
MPELSSSARIMRGFSRIGVGAAALTAVSGLAITLTMAVNDYRSATEWPGTLISKAGESTNVWAGWTDRGPNSDISPWGAKQPRLAEEGDWGAKQPTYTEERDAAIKKGLEGPNPDIAPWAVGRPAYTEERNAAIKRAAAEQSRWSFPSLDRVAFKAAIPTALIGLGLTGAACLAAFGFFAGLGWMIAGFARD